MAVIHVLAGLSLLGLSVYALVCSLRSAEIESDHWKILIVFTGLLLGFILFSGFIQLGSRHSVPTFVLYKLGATTLGGVLLLFSLVARLKDIMANPVRDVMMVLAIFLFGLSLYLGIVV